MTTHIKNLAAAIAFTALLLVAAPPAVAQSVLPASAWGEFKSCQPQLLPVEHRTSAEPTVQDFAPAATLIPIQSTLAISPIPAPSGHDRDRHRSEEPDQPWWQFALQYGAFMISECLVAWRVGLSLRGIESSTGIPKAAHVDAKRNINGDATGPGDRG
jgi:hypothetical protein